MVQEPSCKVGTSWSARGSRRVASCTDPNQLRIRGSDLEIRTVVASRSRRAARRPAPKSDEPEDALDEGAAAELLALSTTDSTTLEADATADDAS